VPIFVSTDTDEPQLPFNEMSFEAQRERLEAAKGSLGAFKSALTEAAEKKMKEKEASRSAELAGADDAGGNGLRQGADADTSSTTEDSYMQLAVRTAEMLAREIAKAEEEMEHAERLKLTAALEEHVLDVENEHTSDLITTGASSSSDEQTDPKL
jgi:membrane-bound ClpP family serine protease